MSAGLVSDENYYLRSLTNLLVKTDSDHLETQTKKEVKAKGQGKKTAKVWNPSPKPLATQLQWNIMKSRRISARATDRAVTYVPRV